MRENDAWFGHGSLRWWEEGGLTSVHYMLGPWKEHTVSLTALGTWSSASSVRSSTAAGLQRATMVADEARIRDYLLGVAMIASLRRRRNWAEGTPAADPHSLARMTFFISG